jgi:DNA invertase Pin-like site-specific DNA recombinase
MKIGYGRVSKLDQNPQAQRDALTAAGCDLMFIEQISSRKKDRPQWQAANFHLRAGDTLVVWKLDRLARSTLELAQVAEDFKARGVHLSVITQGVDTSSPTGKLLYDILAGVAEFERALIAERTAAGLAAARERGRIGGRPAALNDEQRAMAETMLKNPALTVRKIAGALGVSRATLYRQFPNGRG